MLYVITSKIQKFIKSQLAPAYLAGLTAVCNHIKDTKIHQITTVLLSAFLDIRCM